MKIWCLDYRDRVYTDAIMRDVTRFRGINLMRGNTFADTFPADATITVRTRRHPTDHFKAGVFWIVSAKLRTVLDSFGVDAEYLPVRLVDKADAPIEGIWFCLNLTLVLDWFDRNESSFVQEADFATDIDSIRVRPSGLGSAPLAVAAKTIPVLVGVRDDLAESITAIGCTGVVFRAPEAWQNPVNPIT